MRVHTHYAREPAQEILRVRACMTSDFYSVLNHTLCGMHYAGYVIFVSPINYGRSCDKDQHFFGNKIYHVWMTI